MSKRSNAVRTVEIEATESEAINEVEMTEETTAEQVEEMQEEIQEVVQRPKFLFNSHRKAIANPTDEEVQHLSTLASTSAKIRYLAAQGYSTPECEYSGIGHFLGVITQHVRNVLNTPLKKVAK